MKRPLWIFLGVGAVVASLLLLNLFSSDDLPGAPFNVDATAHPSGADRQARQSSVTGGSSGDTSIANPIALYRSIPGPAGRMALDEIYSAGVPVTKQSVAAVQALLSRGVSDDEKVALSRILGALHHPDDVTGQNAEILGRLRALSGDANSEVARIAAITFARLGYFPDSESILASAFERQSLTVDDYFGELAHLVEVAPASEKNRLTSKIKDSSNPYAADILAMSINGDSRNLASLPSGALDDISQLLQAVQPEFPPGQGEFGVMGAIRYSNWLRANMQIESQQSGRSADSLIVDYLNRPNTDPRMVMAYLLTPQANSVLESAAVGSPARSLVNVTNQYASQYSANPMLKQYAEDIARRTDTGKR